MNKSLHSRFNPGGFTIGLAAGLALSVSLGLATGMALGAGLAVVFGLAPARKC